MSYEESAVAEISKDAEIMRGGTFCTTWSLAKEYNNAGRVQRA